MTLPIDPTDTYDGSRYTLAADIFNGYFSDHPRATTPPGDLLDSEPARAWLDLVEWGNHSGLYIYQLPLGGISEPWITIEGRELLMLSAYDYLGLIGHPEVQQGAIEAVQQFGTGTGGVRLLSGTTELHREFESSIAAFLGAESAMTFSSGYLASLGAVSSLLGPRDRVVLDEHAHRSLIDACMLARVPFQRFTHNDPDALDSVLRDRGRSRRTLVIVEGVYSMDGDVCALPAILEVTRRHGAFLMVDEAHSFGALGSTGRGIVEHCGIDPSLVDIRVGSLSKAIPANGGFVATRREIIIYLQHASAPYIFSSALCPASVGAARAALAVLEREPERVDMAHRNGAYLREGLRALGLDTGRSETCIVPVICGKSESAFWAGRELLERGVIALPVVSPAVPRSQARLRLCTTARHSRDDLDFALEAFSGMPETAVCRSAG